MAEHTQGGSKGPDDRGRIQAAALAERALDESIYERVAGRHREPVDNPGAGNGIARVAIDTVRVAERTRGIVRGEILVHSEDASKAAQILEPLGFERAKRRHDCDLPIERFVSRQAGDAVQQAVRQLRANRLRGNANQVVSFSMRGKAGVAPSTSSLDARSAVPAPRCAARVVVIDTGIARNADRRGDGWLDGIAVTSVNLDPLTPINATQGEVDAQGDPYLDDSAGHGTFVAGVVRMAAPHAEVTVIRALDSDGIGSEDVVACAIVRAGEMTPRPHVINLSLGQESPDDHPPLAISLALETLDPEIIVVAAAGNSPDEIPVWPAAFRRVVAVAGLATDGTPARRWSKRGTWVDASAVAESVVAPFVAGTENPDPTRNTDGDLDIWVDPTPAAVWVGTSFAAPHVAGLIAAGVGEGATARQALAEVLAAGTYEPGFGRMITR